MSSPDFPAWLQRELDKRHWAQVDLVRKAHVSATTVSKILSGQRGIGVETCNAIAKAFDIPHKDVLIAAGLYREDKDKRISERHSPFGWTDLDPDDKEYVQLVIDTLLERKKRQLAKYKVTRKREGATPPEAIKK